MKSSKQWQAQMMVIIQTHVCHILLPSRRGSKLRTLLGTIATSNFSCIQLISYQIQISLKCQTSRDHSILLKPLWALTGQGIHEMSGLTNEGDYSLCAISAHPPWSTSFAFARGAEDVLNNSEKQQFGKTVMPAKWYGHYFFTSFVGSSDAVTKQEDISRASVLAGGMRISQLQTLR